MNFPPSRNLASLAIAIGVNMAAMAYGDYYQGTPSPQTPRAYSSDTYSNSTSATISDQELSAKIRDKIGPSWFSSGYENVQAQVNNGHVVLRGTVNTVEDKDKLEKEVRTIDGVRSVNLEISIHKSDTPKNGREFAQDTAASSSDDQLNKKIRDNVSRGWLWNSYKGVSLHTQNGVVTLEGNVDNLSDQKKLVDEIQKIEGVKSVRSNLVIKNR